MKIICIKERLAEALRLLIKISSPNNTLPVLSGIYFEAMKGQLFLKATNLEIGVTLNLRASIKKEGKVVVSGQVLSNLIEGITEKKILIEKRGSGIRAKTKTLTTEIKGIEANEFPLIPQVTGGLFLRIRGKLLAKVITQVLPAMAISSMRPDLGGIYILKKENKVKFVATDGFRLGERTIAQRNSQKAAENQEEEAIIIPGKTAIQLVRIFSQIDEDVDLVVEESQVAISGPGVYVVSRVIDGNFPDYTQIIPNEHKTSVIVNKEAFLETIKLVALFSKADSHEVLISLFPQKGNLRLSAKSKDTGEAEKELTGKIEGKQEKIVLNHRFLTDGINSIDGEKIQLLINNANSPIVMKSFDNKNRKTNFLYIISPIKKQ